MENKFYILALGCKVNTYEIEAIKEELINLGYEQTFLIDDANYIIINTCCVTNTAQAKSRQKLHSLHKQNPNAKIIAMGCYVQGFTNEVSQMNFVNLLVGTNKRSKIKDYFPNLNLNNSINLVEEVKNNIEYENLHVSSYSENTRAFLKIQDGCNNFCSYCIIPYVRGTIKSRPLNEILLETENFLKKGYKEIVLTGIHTGSYGKDLSNFTFSDLVEKLINFEKLYRLRISSIEESEIDEKLISILKSNNKIARHLHIPLQAGSDKILKLMNRKYTQKEFINKIKYIQKQIPDIAISTDVIVGFPQENEDDFLETIKVCKEIGFSKIHVFPYSPRNNTVAAKLNGQIDGKTKKDRVKRLVELSNQLALAYNSKFIGKEVEILVEENDDDIIGHTSNFLKVILKSEKNKIFYQKNDIIKVVINCAKDDYVLAERN